MIHNIQTTSYRDFIVARGYVWYVLYLMRGTYVS